MRIHQAIRNDTSWSESRLQPFRRSWPFIRHLELSTNWTGFQGSSRPLSSRHAGRNDNIHDVHTNFLAAVHLQMPRGSTLHPGADIRFDRRHFTNPAITLWAEKTRLKARPAYFLPVNIPRRMITTSLPTKTPRCFAMQDAGKYNLSIIVLSTF